MSPSKYFSIARISWQNGFVYRLNFVMWRVRMVIQTLTLYFLWSAVTRNVDQIYTYSQQQLLTYILLSSVVVAIVFSSRSIDAQGEIASGDLNNHLVKPLNYFLYWLARDFSDKTLNVFFSLFEIGAIILLLKPPFLFQPNPLFVLQFTISVILAAALYFVFSFIISMTTFWYYQHNGWAQRFLIFTLLNTLGGGLFPLDMLPPLMARIIQLLPTAYFLFFPTQIYLGRLTTPEIITGYAMQLLWITASLLLARFLWKKGLKIYGAYGR